MDLTLQIREMLGYLGEDKKKLILEIARGFVYDYEILPDDLKLIEQAERELADGEAFDWADVEWKELD